MTDSNSNSIPETPSFERYMRDFAASWNAQGCDVYLCDGAFGGSALGPLWHMPVSRISYRFIEDVRAALSVQQKVGS